MAVFVQGKDLVVEKDMLRHYCQGTELLEHLKQYLELTNTKESYSIGSFLDELDFTGCDLSCHDENNGPMEIIVSAISQCTHLKRLSLSCCKMNMKSLNIFKMAFKKQEIKCPPKIDKFDISNNPDIAVDGKVCMTEVAELIRLFSIKEHSMGKCGLTKPYMVVFGEELCKHDYEIEVLDLSIDPPPRGKAFTQGQNYSIPKKNEPEYKEQEIVRGALGQSRAIMINPVELVSPVIPAVKKCLKIDNWYVNADDHQNLIEAIDDLAKHGIKITYGYNGTSEVSGCLVKRIEKEVLGEDNELCLSDCKLKLPCMDKKARFSLAIKMRKGSIPENYLAISPIICCGPSQSRFSEPAEITTNTWLEYHKEMKDEVAILWKEDHKSTWQKHEDAEISISASDAGNDLESALVTFKTKHFSEFIVVAKIVDLIKKFKKWYYKLILAASIYYKNRAVVPVFYRNHEEIVKQCTQKLKDNHSTELLPLPESVSVPIQSTITCSVSAKGFKFSDLDVAKYEFDPRSQDYKDWWFTNFPITCDSPNGDANAPVRMSVLFSVFYTEHEGSYEEIFNETVELDWPPPPQPGTSAARDHVTALVNIGGHGVAGPISFGGAANLAAGSQNVQGLPAMQEVEDDLP